MRHRVLQVIYSLYHGGAERVIETQLLGCDRRRYEHLVCAITSGGDLIDIMANAGARVFLLGKRRRGDVTAATKLARLIRLEKIDLLHLHNAPGMFWGTLGQIVSGTGIPVIHTEHNPYMPEDLPALYRFLYPRFMKRARSVICVSKRVRQSIVETFPGLREKCIEIPNGIRIEDFEKLPPRHECRLQFHLAPGTKLIGTVGRMIAVKNHKLLIEALALVREKVPEANLAILGEGELGASLAQYAAHLGMSENVSLVGETKTIARFYGALDVFCLSSNSEGMPLTLLEALAAGVPIVSTDVGGISEVIESGKNGLLAPKGSARDLAQRITEILLDPAKAMALALNGRETVRTRFAAEKMVKATEQVYEEALTKAARRTRGR